MSDKNYIQGRIDVLNELSEFLKTQKIPLNTIIVLENWIENMKQEG